MISAHINIYFAFTKPQLSFIIRHSLKHSAIPAYLIFIGFEEALVGSNLDSFLNVLCVNAGTGRLFKSNGSALIEVLKFLEERSNESKSLIYPGLLHPLLNAVYARFASTTGYSHYVYAEGISSYLDLKLPFSWKIKFNLLRWVALIKGFSFGISIRGHPHGLDMDNVKGLIAEHPSLLSSHGKPIESLPLENIPFNNSSCSISEVMFIGQPHLDSRIDLLSLYGDMAFGLKEYFQLPLVYKPHHFEPPQQIRAAKSAGFKIIETNLPFEELIEKRRPSVVVSFRSTALINTSRLLDKSAKVYTFAPFLVAPPDECGSLEQLRSVMAMFGVDSFPVASLLGKIEIDLARQVGVRK